MRIGMPWRTGLVKFLFAVLLFVRLPSLGRAQTSCAMEQHVVDSWTATVKADQDAIRQLQQSDKSPEEKLIELKPLNARLQSAVQHLQQAKSKLADCQKKASGGATPAPAKPQPVSLSNSGDAGWKIDGLGTLTLGQADPNSQTVAGVLVVQRDGLEGIPRNTKLTMEGALQGNGNGFSISGSTLTKGNYLDFRKKEVYAYEYRLTLEAQFDDAKTRSHLSGTATLVRSERYRGDKRGTKLESFSITGNYSAPQAPCTTSAPALETEVFDPSNAETSRRYLDRYHQVVAQTSGKKVLSDADVVASAKALLPFLRYVANQQGNATSQSVAQRGLPLERDQKTNRSQLNNPVEAYVTELLGPSTLSTLRTQLQSTATIPRTGGAAAEAAAGAPEVTDAGASLALEIAEGGITIEEIPGGQIIGLGVLGIAGIAEGVYLWEKAHAPSTSKTQECTNDQGSVVVVYRGLKGNNPGELKVDADGLSAFEVLYKPYPCVIGFTVSYRPPKEPDVTIGSVSSVSSSSAVTAWAGTAQFTPQFDISGIGSGHWSIKGNIDLLRPELKRLCPNSVFKTKLPSSP